LKDLIANTTIGMGFILIAGCWAFILLWGYSLKNTSVPVLGVNRSTNQRSSGSRGIITVRTHGANASPTNSTGANRFTSHSITRSRIEVTDGLALLRRKPAIKDNKEVEGSSCPTPKTQTYLRQKLNRF